MIALPVRIFLVVGFFPFITLNITCHSLLACSVSDEKSPDHLKIAPLYITSCFSLAVFKILFLSLIFAILITMYPSVDFLGSSCLGLCVLLDLDICFLSHIRKFSAIIYSNKFFAPFSLSSPSGSPIMGMLVCLMLFQRPLKFSSFFKILFSFFC